MGFSNGGGFVQETPQDLEVQGTLTVDPGGGTLGGGSIIIREFGGQAQIQFDSGAPRETARAVIFSAPDPLDTTRSDLLVQSNADGDRTLEIAMVPPTVIAGVPTRGTIAIGPVGIGVAFPNGVYAAYKVDGGIQTQLLNTNDLTTGDNALDIGDPGGNHVRYDSNGIQAVTAGNTPAILELQPAGSFVQVGPTGGTALVVGSNSLQQFTAGSAGGPIIIQASGGGCQWPDMQGNTVSTGATGGLTTTSTAFVTSAVFGTSTDLTLPAPATGLLYVAISGGCFTAGVQTDFCILSFEVRQTNAAGAVLFAPIDDAAAFITGTTVAGAGATVKSECTVVVALPGIVTTPGSHIFIRAALRTSNAARAATVSRVRLTAWPAF